MSRIIHTRNNALIDDQRQHVRFPLAYMVATDRFLSGWGFAPRRSLFALALPPDYLYGGLAPQDIEEHIRAVIADRTDMIRPRDVGCCRRYGVNGLPSMRLYPGDHLSVRDWDTAEAFYPAMPRAVA